MKIAFYNPSRIIGGAEILFYRLQSELKSRGIQSQIIDYSNGAFIKLGGSSEDLVSISSVLESCTVDCDAIFIPPNFSYEALSNLKLKRNTKILFWSIHPLNCIPILPFRFYKELKPYSKIKKFIDLVFLRSQINFAKSLFNMATERNALLFMDNENYTTANQFLQGNAKLAFLPIPVSFEVKPGNFEKKLKPKNKFEIFWIGRLVDFKIGSLNRLIQDLDTWSSYSQTEIVLHIVGGGKEERLVIEPKKIAIVRHGQITNQALQSLLIERADAAFAMGTSVLEAAAHGIPSFIVAPTYLKVGDPESYTPLPQTKNFDLGGFEKNPQSKSFDQIQLRENIHSMEFRNSCKDYVESNHSLKKVVDTLISLEKSSTLFYSDIEHQFKRDFLTRRFYSLITGK
ncbi:hypothetical protein [Cellvibrio sp. QJXJ]|uniref:hypothetical protein n=1 Tax=Cellvibrio sp. QJXJ TaxID=2964606 RepID=UPI0021C4856B|nr:hypothetical protein [Cellvibrio sp. QJXJ]UUA71427.1 hypothetical protein NNX04_13530 [Cellvibrio sp. QJXJ]